MGVIKISKAEISLDLTEAGSYGVPYTVTS